MLEFCRNIFILCSSRARFSGKLLKIFRILQAFGEASGQSDRLTGK
jgi:hypothetical protein